MVLSSPTRLQRLEELVKELSFQNDPERLVRAFGRQADLFHDSEGLVTINCRNLKPPAYRISRSWKWQGLNAINPYAEPHRLPVFERGLFGDLLYAGEPRCIDELSVNGDDPARVHLEGMRSLACAPSFEQGKPIGLSVILNSKPAHFTDKDLETLLLNANLLGRAAGVMSLAQQLDHAYRRLDHEMEQVGRMQRHLLPAQLPRIEGLSLGASYVTSSRAGGDYYDVLPLGDDQWGLFLADVSGHGVAAAVMVAMLHTLLHSYPEVARPAAAVLSRLNNYLVDAAPNEMFATAFYGVYDARTRSLVYVLAGHPLPRLRRGSNVRELEKGGIPLGIVPDLTWQEHELRLQPGDVLLLYTDGLVEGASPSGAMFGMERLDDALRLGPLAAVPLVGHIERRFRDFAAGAPDRDDRTILAAVAVP
jgi:sigma-B regulation protein RsbU (phosphoserine phosphatase)